MACTNILVLKEEVYWAFDGACSMCFCSTLSPLTTCSSIKDGYMVVWGIRFLTRKWVDLRSFSRTSRFLCLSSVASCAATEHWSSSTDWPLSARLAIALVAAAPLCHLESACCLRSSVAWFQSVTPLVVHAPHVPAGGLPHFWQVLQNMPSLGSSQVTHGYLLSHSFL